VHGQLMIPAGTYPCSFGSGYILDAICVVWLEDKVDITGFQLEGDA